MQANPRCGIAGSRLRKIGWHTATITHSLSIPSPANLSCGVRLRHRHEKCSANKIVAPPVSDVPVKIDDWVAGNSMIIRKEVFCDVGLMDERYFMYFEEVDFCQAAKRAGWETWYVPASRVVHLVGRGLAVERCAQAPQPSANILVRFAPPILCEKSRHHLHRPGRCDVRDRICVLARSPLPATQTGSGSAEDAGRFLRNSVFVRGASL